MKVRRNNKTVNRNATRCWQRQLGHLLSRQDPMIHNRICTRQDKAITRQSLCYDISVILHNSTPLHDSCSN